MPIINVEMLEGRTVDQKRLLAHELTDAFVRSCGGDTANVRVLIREVAPDDWAIGGTLVADR
jgi:4-oxalocrotonate tautomerase